MGFGQLLHVTAYEKAGELEIGQVFVLGLLLGQFGDCFLD
jgi:hypothetical protein